MFYNFLCFFFLFFAFIYNQLLIYLEFLFSSQFYQNICKFYVERPFSRSVNRFGNNSHRFCTVRNCKFHIPFLYSFIIDQSHRVFQFLLLLLLLLLTLSLLFKVASNLNVEFYLSINCLWIQSGILFTLSLYADNTTTALLNVAEIAFQSKWFLLPADLQKHFILMIDISQKPIHFTCIGICNCTLEVFKKVCAV